MPRCNSCGRFTQKPRQEMDGRTQRIYCDFCYAEREWKLEDETHAPGENERSLSLPRLGWWSRFRQWLGKL